MARSPTLYTELTYVNSGARNARETKAGSECSMMNETLILTPHCIVCHAACNCYSYTLSYDMTLVGSRRRPEVPYVDGRRKVKSESHVVY